MASAVSPALGLWETASTIAPLLLKSRAIQPAPAAAAAVTIVAFPWGTGDPLAPGSAFAADATGIATAPRPRSSAARQARAARWTEAGMKVLSRILDPGEALRHRRCTGSQFPLSSTVSRTHHKQVFRLARTSLAYGCGPAPDFDRTSPAGSGTTEAVEAKGSRAGSGPHGWTYAVLLIGNRGPPGDESRAGKRNCAFSGHNDPLDIRAEGCLRRLLSTGSRPRCGPFGWSAPEDDGCALRGRCRI